MGTHASQSLSAGKWRLQAYAVSVSKGFWVVFVDAEAAPVGVLGVVPQVAQNALNLPAVSNIKQRSGCKVRAEAGHHAVSHVIDSAANTELSCADVKNADAHCICGAAAHDHVPACSCAASHVAPKRKLEGSYARDCVPESAPAVGGPRPQLMQLMLGRVHLRWKRTRRRLLKGLWAAGCMCMCRMQSTRTRCSRRISKRRGKRLECQA